MLKKNNNNVESIMVFPPSGDLYASSATSNFTNSLGSGYIIAYLKEKGINALQFTSSETINTLECVKRIVKYDPKIVGFTVFDSNIMSCVLIAKTIKHYYPKLIIAFGGPAPTVSSEYIMEQFSFVDICVRGMAEEVFYALVTTLSSNNYNISCSNLESIQGISFRSGDTIIVNAESDILQKSRGEKDFLDKYPSPY